MNIKLVIKYIGKVLLVESILVLIPMLLAIYDNSGDSWGFFIAAAILAIVSAPTLLIKTGDKSFHAKEGFAIVGLGWICMSFFGAIPYAFSGCFDNFIDCFFESISGFTTTGATLIADIEGLSRAVLLWHNLTLWIGGVGVLVFTIALMPKAKGSISHIMKAEATGPSPSKLVPKLADSSKILYIIYTCMTVFMVIVLYMCGMSFYAAVSHGLSVTATGGFSLLNNSIAGYNNAALEWVLSLGMLVFGMNFSIIFYAINQDIRHIKMNEELKLYVMMVFISTAFITISLVVNDFYSVKTSLRHAFFQVVSIITTTSFTTADINTWPAFSKMLLFILSFFGGSSGSTSGGLKTIRILLIGKLIMFEISRILHPRAVNSLKINGNPVKDQTIRSITVFCIAYVAIYMLAVLLISVDGFDFETNITAAASAINTTGIGFSMISQTGGFAHFSGFSKMVLAMCMLIGRLEIFPILILIAPSFWKKVNI